MDDGLREVRQCGGKPVDVVVAPRVAAAGWVRGITDGLASLLRGLRVTGGVFVHPSAIVTRQYPENRATLQLPARFRATLQLRTGPEGRHACTACRLCVRACPNQSLALETNDRKLARYVWRMESCGFCNACVAVCPCHALEFTPHFEWATPRREELILVLYESAELMAPEAEPKCRPEPLIPEMATPLAALSDAT